MDCDTQAIKLSGIVVLLPHFFGKIGPFLPIFWKKMLFWHRTFAVVLGIRLIRRRWKGCRFWDVPFTVCCGFSNLDTGSSCHSSSSVIALLVVWSDHLSMYKDLRSFVEASDKFRRSLRWIAIHKKSNCLGWLSYFPIFLENWTFFATFLETIVVLAGYFCSFMDIIISGETYRWIWWRQVVQTSPALPWSQCPGRDKWCSSVSSGLNHTAAWIRQNWKVRIYSRNWCNMLYNYVISR